MVVLEAAEAAVAEVVVGLELEVRVLLVRVTLAGTRMKSSQARQAAAVARVDRAVALLPILIRQRFTQATEDLAFRHP